MADMLYDCKIVTDEQVGKIQLLLQSNEQIQDLRLTDTSRADTGSSATMRLGFSARRVPRPAVAAVHPKIRADNAAARLGADLLVREARWRAPAAGLWKNFS